MQEVENPASAAVEALELIRSRWLARLAHDFRGPLFAARGYTKMLLDASDSVIQTHRSYLETVSESLNKIAELVASLQQFPDRSTLRLKPVELASLLRSVAAKLSRADVAAQIETAAAKLTVMTVADCAKLAAAVHNLLAAVVEFAGPDGDARIQAACDGDEITLRFSGARKTPGNDLASANLVTACDMLRLHGGVAHVDQSRGAFMHVTIRLPVIAPAASYVLVAAAESEGM